MNVRFGGFEVDLDSGEVRRGGVVRTRLQDQPLEVLALLVETSCSIILTYMGAYP